MSAKEIAELVLDGDNSTFYERALSRAYLSCSKQRDDLLTKQEGVEQDAKRYKYLRNSATFQNRNGPGIYWYLPIGLEGYEQQQLDANLDAEINRVAKAKEKQ